MNDLFRMLNLVYFLVYLIDESQCTYGNGVLLNFRCYRSYRNEALSWYDARERCLTNGGDLASFDFISYNQGLNVLNGSWLTPMTSYWIDLRKEWWWWQGSRTLNERFIYYGDLYSASLR